VLGSPDPAPAPTVGLQGSAIEVKTRCHRPKVSTDERPGENGSRFRRPSASDGVGRPAPNALSGQRQYHTDRPLTQHMPETFILIPGRTSKQGCGISEGKYTEGYLSEINNLQVAPEDMQRLGLSDGDKVRLRSEWGEIDVAVKASKGDELPPGLLFIPYGDLSSRLMGGETHGSGMPTSKGLDVELELVDAQG